MNDSGLWKRGIFLLILVGTIAGIALFVALRRPGLTPSETEPLCPELLAPMLCNATAPLPGSVNWGLLYHMVETGPAPPGWEIRYNAALTLARKGYPDLPFATFREMLDENQQMKNFSICAKNARMVPDESAARRTVLSALEAFVKWHKQPERVKKFEPDNADVKKEYEAELEQIYQSIAQLSQSSNNVLRTEAKKALQVLGRE